MLLALAAKHDWEVKQGDVNTAFLGTLLENDTVYILVPNYFCLEACEPGAAIKPGYSVRQALAGIPGMPQCPRLWYKRSRGVILKNGLQGRSDQPSLYICKQRRLFLIAWVDDIFLVYPTMSGHFAAELWSKMQTEFDLDEWSDINDCLGAVVTRDRANRRMHISQHKAIAKLLEKAGMANCNPAPTPMVAHIKLTKADCPDNKRGAVMTDAQKEYRSTIASCIWLVTWTRPDLAFPVSRACRYMHNPGEAHMTALKRILRYLKGTCTHGLLYDFSKPMSGPGIQGYYDAAHADCPDTMRSTCAYVFFQDDCPISWHTKLHSCVTTSTDHSETAGAAKAGREVANLTKKAEFLGLNTMVRPIKCYSDSKGSIAMCYNPISRSASKHIAISDYYARELVESGEMLIIYCKTDVMIADALTKPLGPIAFWRHGDKLISKKPF